MIWSLVPGTPLVDLSHGVPAGNVTASAFLLSSSCGFFPKGTVILCSGMGGKITSDGARPNSRLGGEE